MIPDHVTSHEIIAIRHPRYNHKIYTTAACFSCPENDINSFQDKIKWNPFHKAYKWNMMEIVFLFFSEGSWYIRSILEEKTVIFALIFIFLCRCIYNYYFQSNFMHYLFINTFCLGITHFINLTQFSLGWFIHHST